MRSATNLPVHSRSSFAQWRTLGISPHLFSIPALLLKVLPFLLTPVAGLSVDVLRVFPLGTMSGQVCVRSQPKKCLLNGIVGVPCAACFSPWHGLRPCNPIDYSIPLCLHAALSWVIFLQRCAAFLWRLMIINAALKCSSIACGRSPRPQMCTREYFCLFLTFRLQMHLNFGLPSWTVSSCQGQILHAETSMAAHSQETQTAQDSCLIFSWSSCFGLRICAVPHSFSGNPAILLLLGLEAVISCSVPLGWHNSGSDGTIPSCLCIFWWKSDGWPVIPLLVHRPLYQFCAAYTSLRLGMFRHGARNLSPPYAGYPPAEVCVSNFRNLHASVRGSGPPVFAGILRCCAKEMEVESPRSFGIARTAAWMSPQEAFLQAKGPYFVASSIFLPYKAAFASAVCVKWRVSPATVRFTGCILVCLTPYGGPAFLFYRKRARPCFSMPFTGSSYSGGRKSVRRASKVFNEKPAVAARFCQLSYYKACQRLLRILKAFQVKWLSARQQAAFVESLLVPPVGSSSGRNFAFLAQRFE